MPHWKLINWDRFSKLELLYRTQGIDDTQKGERVFSANFGLQKRIAIINH